MIVQDLDAVDVGLLGDTVGAGSDGTGNVGAVATVIVGYGNEGLDVLGATFEFLERLVDG